MPKRFHNRRAFTDISYTVGFLIFSIIVITAIIGLSLVKRRWRVTYGFAAGGRI